MPPQQAQTAFPGPLESQDRGTPRVPGELSAFPEQPNDRLTDAMRRAPDTPPDTAARVFKLQQKTGLPADLIQRNLDVLERQAASATFDPEKFRKDSPLLSQWLAQHPLNSSVAQGDLVPLSALEKTIRLGTASMRALPAGLYSGLDLGTWSALEALGDVLKLPGLTTWAKAQQATVKKTTERIAGDTTRLGPNEVAFVSGFESIGQAAPSLLAGAMTGSASASLGIMGTQTGGQAYSQARAEGREVLPSLGFGLSQGAIEAATEMLPVERLLGDLAAKSGLLKTLGHQLLPELIGEQTATALQNLNEIIVLNPTMTTAQVAEAYRAQFGPAALQTLIATAVSTVVQGSAVHTINRALGGQVARHVVDELGKGAEATELATRSPEKLTEFVDRASRGSGVETFFAPADTWTQYWQSKGRDPAQVAEELLGSKEIYQHAVEQNTRLPIPAAVVATQLATAEHRAFFREELSLGPDEMNARESEAFVAEAEAQRAATAAAEPAERGGVQQVEDDIYRQLVAAKTPDLMAQKYAKLWSAGVGQMASDAGVDVVGLHESYPLAVQREGVTPPAPTSFKTELGQAPRPRVEPVIVGTLDQAAVDILTAKGYTVDLTTPIRFAGWNPGFPAQGDLPEILPTPEYRIGAFNLSGKTLEALGVKVPGPPTPAPTIELGQAPVVGPITPLGVEAFAAQLRDEFKFRGLQYVGVTLTRAGDLELTDLLVAEARRGEGTGSEVLEKVIAFADQHGLRIVARLPEGAKTLPAAGFLFYRGFVENRGARQDVTLTSDQAMYREPTAQGKPPVPAIAHLTDPYTRDLFGEPVPGDRMQHEAGLVSSAAAIAAVPGLAKRRFGMVFLDAQSQPTMFHPVSPAGAEALRLGQRLEAVHGPLDPTVRGVAPPVAVILHADQADTVPAAYVVAEALRAAGVQVYDIVWSGPDGAASVREDTNKLNLGTEYFQSEAPESKNLEQVFYSRLVRAVEASTQNKAPGAQWKAAIKNAKGGISRDEFALARVEDLEDGKTYTKQEVLEYLALNKLTVHEVVLQGEDEERDIDDETLDERAQQIADEQRDEIEQNYDWSEALGSATYVEDTESEQEVEVPVLDKNGKPELDRFGEPVTEFETQTVTVYWPAITGGYKPRGPDPRTGRQRYGVEERSGDEIIEDADSYETPEEAEEAAEKYLRDVDREPFYEMVSEWANDQVDWDQARREAREQLESEGEGQGSGVMGVKYQEYSEKGRIKADSYREVFLTLPKVPRGPGKPAPVPDNLTVRVQDGYPQYYDVYVGDQKARHISEVHVPSSVVESNRERYALDMVRSAWDKHELEKLRPKRWNDGHDEYDPVENPIVRLRFNERDTFGADVVKARVVDPQPDAYGWHVRLEGETESQHTFNTREEAEADVLRQPTSSYRAKPGPVVMFLEEVQPPHDDEFAKMPELFSKNWRELAFKWALRYAVDNNLDGVAWTTGEQQAARYSLEQVVNKMTWEPVLPETVSYTEAGHRTFLRLDMRSRGDITIPLDADGRVTEDGGTGVHERWRGKKLSAVVGEDLAKEILGRATGTIAGRKLRVGGAGLMRLYDVDFKNILQALPAVKKHGGRVGTVRIDNPKPARGPMLYAGPMLTAAQVDLRQAILNDELAETSPAEVDEMPLEAQREYSKRQDWVRTLREMSKTMVVNEMPFDEAIEQYGTAELARFLGGDITQEKPATTMTEQPALMISPELKEAVLAGQALFQNGTEPPARRGSIRFGPNREIIIRLLEGADPSTFLHETGHFFFRVQGDLVAQLRLKPEGELTDAQRRLIADHENLRTWVGAEPGAELTEGQQEQIARAFEAYLREGKAPSLELKSAFASFRRWLLKLYKSLTQLQVELSPEVHKIFDRMLAGEEAIQDAESQRGLEPMFLTPEQAGMTPERFALYRDAIEKASRTRREILDAQLMAEVEREHKDAWKAEQARIRGEVEQEVHAMPVYQALAAITRGTHPDGRSLRGEQAPLPLRLSRTLIAERYGPEALAGVPKYGSVREGGVDPNVVAEQVGFSSGDEMLRAMAAAPAMKQVIESAVNDRMAQEHGSMLSDGTLTAKAQLTMTDLDQERVLRDELRALGELRRTVEPFVQAEQATAAAQGAQADRERAYERRWLEAEAKLRIAIAEGRKQAEIDALAAEVSALKQQRRAGASTIRAALPSAETLRTIARERIGATTIRNLKPAAFWSAARRAGREATETAARHEFDRAIAAKQQELLNLALYREAVLALEDADRRVKHAKSLGQPPARRRIGKAGGTFLDQIDGILDRYSFATVSQKALDRRAPLRKWIASMQGQGLPADLPDELLDDVRRQPYQELTVTELRGVSNWLKELEHLTRLKNKLLKAQDEREFDEVTASIAGSIRKLFTVRPKQLEIRPVDEKYRKTSRYFLEHRRMASLVQKLDGHVDGGPAWSAISKPINQAAVDKQQRNTQSGKAMYSATNASYPGADVARMSDVLFIPEINASLSLEARLMVAMNWGNEGGRDRLTSDPHRQWTPTQIRAILDTLEKRDFDFVQATLDHIGGFWGEIAALEARVTGVAPERVQAVPIDTRFGTYPGGYFPLKYDSRFATSPAEHAEYEAAKAKAAAAYVRQSTAHGHTKERLEHVALPIRLELGVAFEHLDAVIHDLTHREMLIDVTRLLRNDDIKTAVIETQGDIFYKQLTSAVEDIAIGSRPGPDNIGDVMANWMRTGTQMSSLAFNLWTGLQQPLGLFNGMDRVGVKWVAKGAHRWLRDAAHMENTLEWITAVDPMMADRIQTGTQDLAELRATFSRRGSWFDKMVRTVTRNRGTQQQILDLFMWHISLGQRVADVPTWLGMYMKAQAAGETEERAIALARQAVLDSQGGGQIKDLSKIERGGPTARLLMTFFSYGGTVYNASARRLEMVNPRSAISVGQFLGGISLLYVLPGVLTAAMRRVRGDDDDETWQGWVTDIAEDSISTALNGMIYVREGTAALKIALGLDPGVRGYEGPAGMRPVGALYDLAQQINQGKADAGLWHAALTGVGIVARFPSAQARKTIDGWIAMREGTAGPQALLLGPPRKKTGS